MTNPLDAIRVDVNPVISPDQLYSFYQQNNICEAGYSKEVCARTLQHSSLIVAAFDGDCLVGLARALFDGVDAYIAELSLALAYQGGGTRYRNGSLVEADPTGLGQKMGQTLIDAVQEMGAYFISADVVPDCEQAFYRALGFEDSGSVAYCIDRRPYVVREEPVDRGDAS